MKFKIARILKKILPEVLVDYIKGIRRNHRIKKYFAVNSGANVTRSISQDDFKFSLIINPYVNAGVDYHIYQFGDWEPSISDALARFLKKGSVFVDMGANVGYHTMTAASLVGEKGQVFAFEPIPHLAYMIKESAQLNNFSQVTVHEVALSDKKGTATLSLIDENISASSLKDVINKKTIAGTVTVTLETFDYYCDSFSHIDLIKIDVEGNELETLKGGEALLKKFKPAIVMEFSHVLYEHDRVGKSIELINFLRSLGYNFYDLKGNLFQIESVIGGEKEQYDVLCLYSA